MDIGKELRVIVIDEEQVKPGPLHVEPTQVEEDHPVETTVE
jgi:hypothetical protein